jgi:adenylosuccinate lyase
MSQRYETLAEVNKRLAENARQDNESLQKWHERRTAASHSTWYRRPVSLRTFLIVAAILFVGLFLLAGLVFHEAGIVTPLDGMYEWAHTTFGGMEEMPAASSPDKWMW